MRKAAVLALRQARAAFLIIHQHELEALDALPCWMHRLFTALLRCSNFETGAGDTTYATLLAMLTPIQPRRGPRHFIPDMQALKKAVRVLEERRLVRRDKHHSQASERLFFMVDPRYTEARPTRKLKPQTRTPVDSPEASIHAASSATPPKTRTPNSNPSSKNTISHIKETKLSTPLPHVATKAPAHVADLMARLPRRAGGEKRAPEGANPSGLRPTPPGAAPPVSPCGDPFPAEQPSTDRRSGDDTATMQHIGAALT